MELSDWQRNWDRLGKDDPLWAVLTDPTKKGGRWDPSEFFQTGVAEIEQVAARLTTLGLPLPQGKALDFGCGVGRLSAALAAYCAEVHGVDISPSMVEHARRVNRCPDKCQFHLNSSSDLALFPMGSFDFVYSNIALMHIEPRFSKGYMAEFMRVLRPGGIAVFQLLSAKFPRNLVPQPLVDAYRKLKHGDAAFIGMFGVREGEVRRVVETAGGKVAHVDRGAHGPRWNSHVFYTVKA
jgi:SAM-dependent methyltransferase